MTSVFEELLRLLGGTAKAVGALWPQLLALMIGAWAAYHLAVIGAVELGRKQALVVIPVLSAGLVLRLGFIVVALRLVALQLGTQQLLKESGAVEADDDDRDDGLLRLITITLLPFLAVYAAFGYLDDMAREVVLISSFRYGFGEILGALNPVANRTTMLITLVLVVGLYVLRRIVDVVHERTGRTVFGVLTTFLEACFLFVVILSGFRILEQIGLWLSDRRLAAWWDGLLERLAAALAIFRIDLPAVLTVLGRLWTEEIWPTLWTSLTQPIAWLAMAALVFGSHVLSVAELWRRGQAASAARPGAARSGATDRAAARADRSSGFQRVMLQAQEALLGDIDDKYLPTFQSIRLVLKAGIPFLGAYIALFTLLQLGTSVLGDLIDQLIGGQDIAVWIQLQPVNDLVPQVLQMALQVALLAVAFNRALTLFAARGADTGVAPAPVRRRVLGGLPATIVSLLLVVALAWASGALDRRNQADVVLGRLDEPVTAAGSRITVDSPELAATLSQERYGDTTTMTTDGIFVTVMLRDENLDAGAPAWRPRLRSGDRSYTTLEYLTSHPDDGFARTQMVVFELDPADVAGAQLVLVPGSLFTGYSSEIHIDLHLDPADLPAARDRTVGVVRPVDGPIR